MGLPIHSLCIEFANDDSITILAPSWSEPDEEFFLSQKIDQILVMHRNCTSPLNYVYTSAESFYVCPQCTFRLQFPSSLETVNDLRSYPHSH